MCKIVLKKEEENVVSSFPSFYSYHYHTKRTAVWEESLTPFLVWQTGKLLYLFDFAKISDWQTFLTQTEETKVILLI